jgi:hypothetical protein
LWWYMQQIHPRDLLHRESKTNKLCKQLDVFPSNILPNVRGRIIHTQYLNFTRPIMFYMFLKTHPIWKLCPQPKDIP